MFFFRFLVLLTMNYGILRNHLSEKKIVYAKYSYKRHINIERDRERVIKDTKYSINT